jgi:3',5'-cyclic AMP phosphodiesterase CpdA
VNDRFLSQSNGVAPSHDDVDRRGFLSCMAWVGTGLVWSVSGGVLSSRVFGQEAKADKKDFSFVQISDSHIGFNKPPNTDVTATLKVAVNKINALREAPSFVLHTGDLTHLAKPAEFDTVAEVLKGVRAGKTLYVPGEHDVFTDEGKRYLERFGKGTRGTGWYSFDFKGVHFIGLVNVANLKPGGMGTLGAAQLDWLKKDVGGLGASTPIVVFAHVPLWTVYEKWGWGTQDGAKALELLKKFGSVTVLNGHIHQAMKKVEGKVTFHTACSTAFPQPAPGKAASPGPVKNVAAEKLRSVLGLSKVSYVATKGSLAIVDPTLE